MSEVAMAQEGCSLEQIRSQLSKFMQQREQIRIQFEQLQGAIFACEQLIDSLEGKEVVDGNSACSPAI